MNMATDFKLYGVEKEDLYAKKPKDEKEKLREEMVKMALERGIKPAARYYNTYPSTVRRWVNEHKKSRED